MFENRLNLLVSINLVITVLLNSCFGYSIPIPTLEVLTPKGFRISIPDEPGIVLFAFHGAINQQLKGVAAGDFSGETKQSTNGLWTYENRKEFLDPGDILYYWIHVQHGNHAYRLLDRSIVIPGNEEDNIPSSNPIPSKIEEITTEGVNQHQKLPEDNDPNTCTLSKTTVNGRRICQRQLIFEDTFDVFNWTKWQREIGIPSDSDDADFVSFQDFTENSYIVNGNLHIVPTLLKDAPGYSVDSIRSGEINFGARCTAIVDIDVSCRRKAGFSRVLPPVVSARLRTKNFFSFRYGRVEVRAKMPIGDWLFPQILLQPFVSEYGITGYASGQMRVAFIRSNEILENKDGEQIDGKRVSGGPVLKTGEHFRDMWLKSSLRRDHLGLNFHTYSLTWTDESITLAIDGNDYAIIKGGYKNLFTSHNITNAEKWGKGEYMAPFDKEFYLVLGVSAGGISDFPDGCRTGAGRSPKPWRNPSPKAELRFWNDRSNWYQTWNAENSGLTVDYIRVWSL